MAWQQNQGSPIAGVLLQERDLKSTTITNHLDRSSLLPFAPIGDYTHLGTRDIYALSHVSEVPFLLPNIKAGNIIPVNDGHYTFDLSQFTETDTTIVSVSNPGEIEAGVPFEMVVSNGKLGAYGSRLTPNPTRPYAVEVTDMQTIGGQSGQVKYTVVYNGNVKGEDKLPADVLTPGRKLYKLSATRSTEFGQEYDGWQVSAGPNRKYIARISDFEIQTHYHMTYDFCNFADGHRIENKDWVMRNLNKVVDFIGITNPYNPNIKTLTEYAAAGGSKSAIGFNVMATAYDRISIGILEKEIQNTLVFDPGGVTGHDGHDKKFIHPGVWHQMEYSGYKHTFNIATASKDMLLAAIRAYEAGKKIQPSIGETRTYNIRTGAGGVALLQKWFKAEYDAQVTGLVIADRLGQYKGTYDSGIDVKTPYFTSITVDSGRYKLTFTEDKSLNPLTADPVDNPLIGQYRLSSYAMIIEDADFSASNIKILRNSFVGGGGMRMFVVNGNRSHPFYEATNAGIPIHQGQSLASGFGAYFHAVPDTAIVWDPTRMLRLNPINPFTGIAF